VRIVLVAFGGVQTLDLTGPAEVFAAANRARGRAHYQIVIAGIGGGELVMSCGLPIRVRDLSRITPHRSDTIVVAGGEDAAVRAATGDGRLRRWLRRAAPIVTRLASVCSGAFVLAGAGLLDGKRATTHWSACDELARMFPAVDVDRNAIFVRDGKTWTSAGVTTGIDMALALVEADLGARTADDVAARLVLYVRRPGFQSQWSDALVAQQTAHDPLGPAIAWARAHVAVVDLESLARHAGLSARTLHRRCLAQLGTTPAKLLDKLRVEHARELLHARTASLKEVAARCGLSPARLTRAFERELGMSPRAYRLLHATAA